MGNDPSDPPPLTVSNFTGQHSIRQIITEKSQKAEQCRKERKITPTDHLTALIKPGAESKYEDLVNILDEMSINEGKTYFIMNITQTTESPWMICDNSASSYSINTKRFSE